MGTLKKKLYEAYEKCSHLQKTFIMGLLFFIVHLLLEWPIWEHADYDAEFLCQWDCQWYKSIILDGYMSEPPCSDGMANFAFFPLLPLIAKGIYSIYRYFSPEFYLFFISEYVFFLDIFVFMFFVKAYFKDIPEYIAAATLTFMPFSVHAMAGYTESTFLLLSMMTILSFGQKKYLQSGIFGAFLTAARPVGALIIPALALPQTFKFFKAPLKDKTNLALCFMLMPLGLFLFMYYLEYKIGDALAFAHVQIAWGSDECFFKPFCVLLNGLKMPLSHYHFVGAVVACFSLFFCYFLYKRKKYELTLFLLFSTLCPMMIKMMSMMRFLFWNPVFLLMVCYFLNKYKRHLWIILPIVAAYMMQIYFYFLSGETLWPV